MKSISEMTCDGMYSRTCSRCLTQRSTPTQMINGMQEHLGTS